MKYQIIVLLSFGIRNTFQDEHLCYNKTTVRRDVCCNNYEWAEGKCNKCKIGTTTEAGGRCSSCQNDLYGEKCGQKCSCDETERCDAKEGCIPNTNSKTTNITETTLHASSNGSDSAKAGTVTKIGTDWIIYTLCITTCVCLTGFGHCFLTYRKRLSLKVRAITATTVSETLTPYIGKYTQVDKKPLTFVTTGSNVASKESHNETIHFVKLESQSYTESKGDDEAGYFDLYFDRKEDVDHPAMRKKSLSISSLNSKVGNKDNTEVHELHQEYFHEDSQECEVSVTVHKTLSSIACNGDDEDDEAGYFDLYFAMKEDVNQLEEHHTLRNESRSTSSFNSNVVSQDNTKFYEPLSEYFREDAHACEVSVTDHERQFNTASNEDDEVDEAGYFDLYFGMKDDVNHQEEQHALPQKSLSYSSFNSKNVGQDDTEFLKPLSEYYLGDPDACEVSLSVNQCIERSSLSKEDAASKVYVNVYQLLQNDRQTNSHLTNGNRLSPDSYPVRDETLKTAIPARYRTSYSQYCTNKYAESEITINACGSIKYNKDRSITAKKSKTI